MEFHKYEKIYALGHSSNMNMLDYPNDIVDIEEKIDGANFRTYLRTDGSKIFGSHRRELGETDVKKKDWIRCVKFLSEKLEQFIPHKEMILFGECCTVHTLKYDLDKIPPFLAFDVMVDNEYLPYNEKIELFESLGLPYVPLVKRATAAELKQYQLEHLVPVSEYADPKSDDKLAEGIVIKNYKRQMFAKFVREKFKEKNGQVFGQSKKWAENPEDIFTAVYVTNARIEKIILKLMDEGQELGTDMMSGLATTIWKDIWDEEYEEIIYKFRSLNFRVCRTNISKRAYAVLKQMMANQVLAKKE